MRILYFVDDLDRYGADGQLLLLARHLPRDQFDVHVCALSAQGELAAELKAAGVPLTILDRRWPLGGMAVMRLSRLLGRLRPDVVHTGGFDATAYARLAAWGHSRLRQVAATPEVDRRQPWHRSALGRRLAAKTGAIVAARETVRDRWVQLGWPAEKMVVIPPGFAPAAVGNRAPSDLTAKIGLPEGVHLIGIFGQLEVDQGWKEVIWTLDILRCLRDDVHVVVVGDGPQRWQLERFARLCTLDSHVHFLGRRADAPQWLPHFNQVWQGPGGREVVVAAAEALAAGVPVVASDTEGNRELVIHDQTGFIVPIGGRIDRARYANRLINDLALRTRLGEAGRRRMGERFGLAEMVQRHVDLYRRIGGA
jgi:glycosyltransferase involved in cell wall biosynthesis